MIYVRYEHSNVHFTHSRIWLWYIRTNYIKAKIDNMQWKSKCRLCSDKDKIINHIISKRALKEYKSQYNWVGKVIHWESCKKLKFDHTTKWHMHKPESVLENKMHKIL